MGGKKSLELGLVPLQEPLLERPSFTVGQTVNLVLGV